MLSCEMFKQKQTVSSHTRGNMGGFRSKWKIYLLLILIVISSILTVLPEALSSSSSGHTSTSMGKKKEKKEKDEKDEKQRVESGRVDKKRRYCGMSEEGKVRASHRGGQLNLWDEQLMRGMLKEWFEVKMLKPEHQRMTYYGMQKKYERIAKERNSAVIPYTTVR